MTSSLLIVDDDAAFVAAAVALAHAEGFETRVAHSAGEARSLMARSPFDLLLIDLTLPDGSGLDLLPLVDPARHGRVAIVTGHPSIESASHAVSSPVDDYLVKPLQPGQLVSMLRASRALPRAGAFPPGLEPIPGVITHSRVMHGPTRLARQVAATDASVMLLGETGTGKALFARALHAMSGLRGAFVAMNCAALPPELLAGQLFGHVQAHPTGTAQRHIGVIEQAAGGTLFLDEITAMPVELQAYLLQALEGHALEVPEGDAAPGAARQVRLVTATKRDPRDALAEGALRDDLFYRLTDFTIALPPLRERGDDVVLLARHFLAQLNGRYELEKRLATSCIRTLKTHAWPGNVRELRSAVQRAFLLTAGDEVLVVPQAGRPPPPRETEDSITFVVGTPWAEMERATLLKVLAYCGNDKTAAARMLGISVRTIHNHLGRISQQESR